MCIRDSSSRCLAAGLTVAKRQRPAAQFAYHAFDFFSSFPSGNMRRHGYPESNAIWQLFKSGLTKPLYVDSLWHKMMVRPVYKGAKGHAGDIEKETPLFMNSKAGFGRPVEIWSIDSAKSHAHFVKQAAAVWPRLRVGSIIHLMDCSKHQLAFFFERFVMTGDVECVFGSFDSAPWSFVVRKAPLDWSKVTQYYDERSACANNPAVSKALHTTVDRFGKLYQAPQALIDSAHRRLVEMKGCAAGAP